jgi:kynurenine formamidase
MQIIDLSHPISENTPVYPGTPSPVISEMCTVEKHGFREKNLTLTSHTSTHIDAPAHILKEGSFLDDFPISTFYGSAYVLDASADYNSCIDVSILQALPKNQSFDFILFYTGCSRYWGNKDYFDKYSYPTDELAKELSLKKIKGIGIDAISVDALDASDLHVHNILLSSNIIIIENLTNLDKLLNKSFQLACFPLKIHRADGSPVRAVAILD